MPPARLPTRRSIARLLVLGPGRARVVELGESTVTIGRGTSNTVMLDTKSASRSHCLIEPEGDRYVLRDLCSTNGFRVNARRVGRTVLEDFDRIQIGDTVLVYLDGETDNMRVASILGAEPVEESTTSFRSSGRGADDTLLWLLLLLQELHSEVEFDALLELLLGELTRQVGQPWASLVLCSERRHAGQLRTVHAVGHEQRTVELERCTPLVRECLAAGKVSRRLVSPGVRVMAVPVIQRGSLCERYRSQLGQVEGALLLPDPGELSSAADRLLRAVGRQLAGHLAQAALERQATTDPLTRLARRGFLEERAMDELAQARARSAPLSLILLDVDDFKSINDTHGHLVGDAVLRDLGQRLPGWVRATDLTGRWGGEEFLVVLPGTGPEGARQVADKIVAGLPGRAVPGTPGLRVTVSAGVSSFPTHGDAFEDLLARADLALYRAKQLGKNQVRAYGAEFETTVELALPDPAKTARMPLPAHVDLLTAEDAQPLAYLHSTLMGTIPLHAGEVVLGRDASCGVVLPHPSVSRRHARLCVTGPDDMWFHDHSSNGSWHNGDRVEGPVAVAVGDRLKVGPFDLVVRRDTAKAPEDQTWVV